MCGRPPSSPGVGFLPRVPQNNFEIDDEEMRAAVLDGCPASFVELTAQASDAPLMTPSSNTTTPLPSNHSHMPYSIVMEIGLQTSGILTSWVEAPLTMDRDNILFRNLDATAEMLLPDIDLRGKTIINTTHATGYSMLGSMGIHRPVVHPSAIPHSVSD